MTIASDEIIPTAIGDYLVFIKAEESSSSGWTGSAGLQPRIPSNTRVVVNGEKWKWFFPNKTSAAGHIVLSDGATLQILAQDQKGSGPDLYARITGDNSHDAGKKGWLHRLGLNIQGDGPLLFAPPSVMKLQSR